MYCLLYIKDNIPYWGASATQVSDHDVGLYLAKVAALAEVKDEGADEVGCLMSVRQYGPPRKTEAAIWYKVYDIEST